MSPPFVKQFNTWLPSTPEGPQGIYKNLNLQIKNTGLGKITSFTPQPRSRNSYGINLRLLRLICSWVMKFTNKRTKLTRVFPISRLRLSGKMVSFYNSKFSVWLSCHTNPETGWQPSDNFQSVEQRKCVFPNWLQEVIRCCWQSLVCTYLQRKSTSFCTRKLFVVDLVASRFLWLPVVCMEDAKSQTTHY